MQDVLELGKRAKKASQEFAYSSTLLRNSALEAMAHALEKNSIKILEENAKDMDAAREKGTEEALLDRLRLDDRRIEEITKGLRELIALPDPIGEVVAGWRLPNGLDLKKVRVPLGVVGMIFEARPNVCVDSAALCIKSANAVILKGGSMAFNSNVVLAETIAKAAEKSGLPTNSIQLLARREREATVEMMGLTGYIDVLIPRGGHSLIRSVVENAKVPVIETGEGVCHVYVDEFADLEMAAKIVINAKCQRPGVCNAAETLLVHAAVAKAFLPTIGRSLKDNGVEIFASPDTMELMPWARAATEENWSTEYLSLKISIKTVSSIDEAIAHITRYGTRHSEAIVTSNYPNARKFTERVDAAAVYVNASTRFTDGGQYGMGAEIGISTQKLHARGPMGIKELTSIKYIAEGSGQVRE